MEQEFYKIFYLALLLCVIGVIYVIFNIIKNREYYSLKNIWHRMKEERESSSLSSLPFKLLGLKVPNVTSRKFDAIFILIVSIIVLLMALISIVLLILEKMSFI